MVGIHLMNSVPGDAGNRLARGQRLRQLDLEWIDARDVMHDDADGTAVLRYRSLPFRWAQRSDESGESIGSLFDAIGKCLCTTHDGLPID